MMYVVLFLIFISLSVCLSILYKKKFESTLVIGLLSVIFIMYISFIFNKLVIGLYFIYVLVFLLYLISIMSLIKNRKNIKEILSNLFTPSFLVFLVLYIILIFLTKNWYVTLWDELRLWALYPKSLYYYDTNILVNLGGIQSRVPGMPLFMYFVTKTFGEFKDSLLFLSFGVISVSIILPICKNLTFKKWYKVLIFILIVFLYPLAFSNNRYDYGGFYRTLFIDPSLGILFGYSLYLVYKGIKDNTDLIKFIFILIGMILFKETGMLLAILSIVYLIVDKIVNRNKDKSKFINYKKIIIIIVSVIVVLISWYVVSNKLLNITNITGDNESLVVKVTNFIKSPSSEDKSVISNYIRTILNKDVLKTRIESINFTLLEFLGLFSIIYIILFFKSNTKERKKLLIFIVSFYIFVIVYLLFYLGIYLFLIKNVESYSRYLGTITSALSMFTLYVMLDKYDLKDRLVKIFLIIVLVTLPVTIPRVMEIPEYFEARKIEADGYREYLNTIDIEENSKVVIVHYGSFARIMNEYFGYVAIKDKIIASENYVYKLNSTNDKSLDEMIEEFDASYVFFNSEVKRSTTELNEYIDTMESGYMYKIIKENGKYKFKKIVQK